MDSFNPSLVHGGGPSNLAGCAQRAREIGGAPLPCLSSNISTEICSTQHRKAASALGWNVIALLKTWPPEPWIPHLNFQGSRYLR